MWNLYAPPEQHDTLSGGSHDVHWAAQLVPLVAAVRWCHRRKYRGLRVSDLHFPQGGHLQRENQVTHFVVV